MCTVDHMSSIPHKENEENKMQWDRCHGLKSMVVPGKKNGRERKGQNLEETGAPSTALVMELRPTDSP